MGKIFEGNKSTIARKSLVTYVNVGTSSEPEWYALGYHCDDSSISIEQDSTTSTDILGNSYTDVGPVQLSQDLDPLPVVVGKEADNKFMQRIHDLKMAGDYTKFSNAFDCMIVYMYAGEGTPGEEGCKYDAQRYPASTIVLGDFGGSADSPLSQGITVNFGGAMEQGSVTYKEGVPTWATE